jgi:hypothetical protein
LIAIVAFWVQSGRNNRKHIRDPVSAIYPVALGLPLLSSSRDVLKGSTGDAAALWLPGDFKVLIKAARTLQGRIFASQFESRWFVFQTEG